MLSLIDIGPGIVIFTGHFVNDWDIFHSFGKKLSPATTYDVIDKSGAFIGGAIAPGMDISARYLFKKAALLRDTAFTFPENAVGRNTETNLQSGIMFNAIDATRI